MIIRRFLLFFLLLVCLNNTQAQGWEKVYWFVHSSNTWTHPDQLANAQVYKAIQLKEGGYASIGIEYSQIVGFAYLHYSSYILRLDVEGDTLWSKAQINPDSSIYINQVFDFFQSPDQSGFYSYNSFYNITDPTSLPGLALQKISPQGDLLWSHYFPKTSYYVKAKPLPNNGVAVVQLDSSSHFVFTKIDGDGNLLSETKLDSITSYQIKNFELDIDGNPVFLIYYSNNDLNYLLRKIDLDGNVLWEAPIPFGKENYWANISD
jgi:hypothetical protein